MKVGVTANVGRFGARYLQARLNNRALKPSPCRRRGTALAVDEVSKDKNARHCMSSSRSSNPAGRSPSPPGTGMPAASRQRGVGWRGSPLHTITGADSGFRRTLCLHPRRAKRRAQVCGDSTVQNDGRWAGSPHPPQAVPLPLRGEGLNAPESGLDFESRARHFPQSGE